MPRFKTSPKSKAHLNWHFILLLTTVLLTLLTLFLIFHPNPAHQSESSDPTHQPGRESSTSNTEPSDQSDPSNQNQSNQDQPDDLALGNQGPTNSDQPSNVAPGQSSSDNPKPNSSQHISGNCTENLGILMLINPNFTVNQDFITARSRQLISISQTYGIPEYHRAGNGDNLLLPEAAAHLNGMVNAYKSAYPGHEIGTYSCFRARGTSCGRLCAATGASDHHTGLTCDLIDLSYGTVLDTDDYPNHVEWQWLRANSYKYGFIDRFPEAWAGGPMSEPLNVDTNGTTGLYETWHYRYVGIPAATDIATGKYNQGSYDSLEHYLKSTGRVRDLKPASCQ